ncbi:MAG TPA: ATP-binding protein [Gemmatimonadaceae bacterium]
MPAIDDVRLSGAALLRAKGGTLSLRNGLLLFGVISLLGNAIGAAMRYPEIGSAVLFPPYAALTAALVVSSRRHWVWFILVGDLTHFVAHWPQFSVSWILFADVANICRALTAAVLLRWLFRDALKLDGIVDLLRFVASAVVIAPAVGATIGAANVVLHGGSDSYLPPWGAWFTSNALTGLTMLPAFLLTVVNGPPWRGHWTRSRVIEVVVLGAVLAATCTGALMLRGDSRWQLALILYAPLPVLIWTALRFECVGASYALTAVAFTAIWAADRRIGPFLTAPPDEYVLDLQLFVGLTSLTVLCIAAVSSARNAAFHLHRALMASVHDHVAILDARGVVVEVNEAWRRFAETPNIAPSQRVVEGDDYIAACRAAVDDDDRIGQQGLIGVLSVLNGDRKRYEIEYDDSWTGTPHRYSFSIEALESPDGGAIAQRRDVTARRREQLEMEEQRRELSHLARVSALGQLSGALAHELNQPLASIGSNAEAARILLKRRPLDNGEIDNILRDILSENQRAAEVIRRLRALLRRGETRLQPLNATELISEVLELAHAELITRRVTATSVIAPNLPPVLGDRVQLQQVLLNLILNACEAMRSTRPSDRRLVLLVNAGAPGQIQVSIRDCGTGISPELIERLFEPFVTTKPEGLGLGLSISRTIVAAHGGRVWAENNADGGATLHFVLSAAVPEATAGELSFMLGSASAPSSAAAR